MSALNPNCFPVSWSINLKVCKFKSSLDLLTSESVYSTNGGITSP